MSELNIGYACVSTDAQDLTAQRDGLAALCVSAERVYVDGLTGTNRERPGLREALAACRAGDSLVVTKLDRLARSLPDARAIADELSAREVKLNLGGSVHDPDPVGRLLFNVLAMVAEFEADLVSMRTREGMKVAKAKGRLRGKQPKLSAKQEAHLVALHAGGEHTIGELEELFTITRSTVYRAARTRHRPGHHRRWTVGVGRSLSRAGPPRVDALAASALKPEPWRPGAQRHVGEAPAPSSAECSAAHARTGTSLGAQGQDGRAARDLACARPRAVRCRVPPHHRERDAMTTTTRTIGRT